MRRPLRAKLEARQRLTRLDAKDFPQKSQHKIPYICGYPRFRILVRYYAVAIPLHRRILGETLRTCRKQRRLSQEQVAEKAELNPKYLSQVECGNVNISLDALAKIAKALKLRINDLTRRI